MGCKINLDYSMSINDLLQMGRNEAAGFAGHFKGDTHSGDFNIQALGGSFIGYYSVYGNTIEVVLSTKPFFMPCTVIEAFLKAHVK